MDRYLARKPRKLDWIDGRKPTRDELHDRSGRTPHPTSPLEGGRREDGGGLPLPGDGDVGEVPDALTF